MAARGRAGLLILAVAFLSGPGSAAAQQLTGTALGPDGQPLVDVPVALHRVGPEGSAFAGTDTTDAAGGFRFELSSDSAVYFAAVRYGGRMYLGPAIQPGSAPVANYRLQVDPASEAGAVASALSGQQPRPTSGPRSAGSGNSDAGALMLVGLLALASAAAFFFAAPRYRDRRTREVMIELASIENALAGADEQDRARLKADRDRLRDRLAPRS